MNIQVCSDNKHHSIKINASRVHYTNVTLHYVHYLIKICPIKDPQNVTKNYDADGDRTCVIPLVSNDILLDPV